MTDAFPPTQRVAALLWRVCFLAVFGVLNLYYSFSQWGGPSLYVNAACCLAGAVLLGRRSPWAQLPIYLAAGVMVLTVVGGIDACVRDPALLNGPMTQVLMQWALSVVPAVGLIACGVYAQRLAGDGLAKRSSTA